MERLFSSSFNEYIDCLTKYRDSHQVVAFDNVTATEAEELAVAFEKFTTRKIITIPFSRVAEVIDESKAKCGDLALIDLFIQGFGPKLVIFIKEFETFLNYPDKELFYSVLRVNIDALIVLTGNDIREVAKELLRNV